ncbi:hypothetical protein HYU94_00745 [Candidatus Daviesbacteria bacterium]|nr:hypothetical protein [Candidatus Daviesbacteria bacterium]
MVRLLPFILIPILIVAGLGFWRYLATKQNLTTPEVSQDTQDQSPVEVPKTLPAVTVSPAPITTPIPTGAPSVLDPGVAALESAVADLKTRVESLEKGTTVSPGTTKSSTAYIPLGTGGGGADKGWVSINSYGATIDPAEYPGYSTMQLEVNLRLTQKVGTAYARLYNSTDQTAKEQVSTTSDSFSWQSSTGFTLPSGKKSYTLQMKSTDGTDVQLQSARIKVNF